MPLLDDINLLLRDHEGYTGDGKGGVGVLPVGDRSTARKVIDKRDLRALLNIIAQTMGDPDALQEILDRVGATESRGLKFYNGRSEAIASLNNLPLSTQTIIVPESPVTFTIRNRNQTEDDPLVPGAWGVYHRFQRYQDIVALTSVGGTRTAYSAATVGAGSGLTITANRTLLPFVPHVTNGQFPTISIDGAAPVSILGEDGGLLPEGRLIAGARYLLMMHGSGNYICIGAKGAADRITPERLADANVAAGAARISSYGDIALASGGSERLPIMLGAGSWSYWNASCGDGDRTIVVANGERWVNLDHLRVGDSRGSLIQVKSGSTARVITRASTRTIVGPATVRVVRPIDDTFVFDPIEGNVTLDSGGVENAPSCAQTIISAGQSLAALCFQTTGLYGFQRGMVDEGADYSATWAVQGATGGSGLTSLDGAVYWWDHVTNTPGPAALTWKAALDAIPATQPKPSAIYWAHGQNTAQNLGTGLLTPANVKTWLAALFAWMREQIDPITPTPIILSPVGTGYQGTPENRLSRMRQIEVEIIQEDPHTYLGPQYFDLPRRHNDVHLSEAGAMLQGYRLGIIFGNVIKGRSAHTGAYVSKIEELSGGKRYVIHIARPAGHAVTTPGIPDGLAVFAAGADLLTAQPAFIEGGSWSTVGGGWQANLFLAEAVPGATIMWPYGMKDTVPADRYIRDVQYVPAAGAGNYWPLQPVVSGAFG